MATYPEPTDEQRALASEWQIDHTGPGGTHYIFRGKRFTMLGTSTANVTSKLDSAKVCRQRAAELIERAERLESWAAHDVVSVYDREQEAKASRALRREQRRSDRPSWMS